MILEPSCKSKTNYESTPLQNNVDDGIIDVSEYREVLFDICRSIEMGGFNPVSQIVGFIVSEDPTHIANFGNARNLMTKIDRDILLEDMVRFYLEKNRDEKN